MKIRLKQQFFYIYQKHEHFELSQPSTPRINQLSCCGGGISIQCKMTELTLKLMSLLMHIPTIFMVHVA